MKISAVDQSPIFSNTNADQAIRETKDLAKYCDSLGLNRFWLAEHHGSNSFAGCSPEILIPSLAAQTESIRVGSGGVMLMHYSPYKVAENFRLLESLFPKETLDKLKTLNSKTISSIFDNIIAEFSDKNLSLFANYNS